MDSVAGEDVMVKTVVMGSSTQQATNLGWSRYIPIHQAVMRYRYTQTDILTF
jgi:hypothetical protein